MVQLSPRSDNEISMKVHYTHEVTAEIMTLGARFLPVHLGNKDKICRDQ